jgi:hypothetical protein
MITTLTQALTAAGLDADRIQSTPEGITIATTTDGRVCVGRDNEGWFEISLQDGDGAERMHDSTQDTDEALARILGWAL